LTEFLKIFKYHIS